MLSCFHDCSRLFRILVSLLSYPVVALVLVNPVVRFTRPYHLIFRSFTDASRCVWEPASVLISCQTDSFVLCTVYGVHE